jgi:hypothetical protein
VDSPAGGDEKGEEEGVAVSGGKGMRAPADGGPGVTGIT